MNINSTAPLLSSSPIPREALESGELTTDWSRAQMLATLKRREAMLRAASFASAQFLTGTWEDSILAVLECIGTAADVSRVFLYENERTDGQLVTSQRYQWIAPKASPHPEPKQERQQVDVESRGLGRWAEVLASGNVIQAQTSELPEEEAEILRRAGTISLAAIPINVEGVWWGSLTFSECRHVRQWDDAEIEVFRLFADLIGAGIAHKRSDEALQSSEREMRALFDAMQDAFFVIDRDGRYRKIVSNNPGLLYKSEEEMTGNTMAEVIGGDLGREFLRVVREVLDTRSPLHFEYKLNIEGKDLWFSASVAPLMEDTVLWVARDISQAHEAREALRLAEQKYRSIFENAVEGIFQTTPDGYYVDANPSLARIYGYSSPDELKVSLTNIGRQLYISPNRRDDFVEEMSAQGYVSNFEAQIRRKDGEIIWISENARAVTSEEGQLLFYEGTVEDITARKVAEEQLLHDALHDKLTGLANRALFMDRLGQSFSRLRRHPDSLFAVLFLDFDRFKNVNDSLGHMAGDQLLISVSGRLQSCLRPGDTVSRLGGDEFAILLEDVTDVTEATLVAERIQTEMTEPFLLVGQQVFSSASIGIALANVEYEKPEDLLRDADMAMYRAKAMGKARHEVFDAGMHTRAVALLQLETDLRWAIERQEFKLYYQPIVSLVSGRITGFEALIRWQHPQRGLVSPGEFIPVAEETGWIVPIGRWVLEEACGQLAKWQKTVPSDPPLTISVNLSGKQFSQPDLIPSIEELLREYDLPPGSLKLEITESAIMENAQAVTDRLLRLRAIGVKLGLDDFGTGYSSLSYLHRFPLDTLKIDRSFVARMNEGGENREIVRTIVSLGKNLGMDVVAEGVEDTGQLSDLRDLNCQHGQGFFFAKPLPSRAAFALLTSKPLW